MALAYAPAQARGAWLAFFALDAHFARLVRSASEPMLAQLRIAWWRETLAQEAGQWPRGDPVLDALAAWNGHHATLASLADGWEAITAPAPLAATAMAQFAAGRGEAVAGLAHVLGEPAAGAAARRLANDWSLADLAMRLSREDERGIASGLSRSARGQAERLPRALRPVAILRALALRKLRRGDPRAAHSPAAMLTAMRLGLLGR